ncbi:MAG: hypothetical protein LIO69_08450, partial [Oscillospiraceae bacterium]|nr:hypothetical protein [Oscillospiraceae bacterium]
LVYLYYTTLSNKRGALQNSYGTPFFILKLYMVSDGVIAINDTGEDFYAVLLVIRTDNEYYTD